MVSFFFLLLSILHQTEHISDLLLQIKALYKNISGASFLKTTLVTWAYTYNCILNHILYVFIHKEAIIKNLTLHNVYKVNHGSSPNSF